MRIKAAVTREKGKLEIEELNLAEPKLGEVVVKMIASGVCHTDSSTMEVLVPTKLPIVLGHEGVGIVEKVGEGRVYRDLDILIKQHNTACSFREYKDMFFEFYKKNNNSDISYEERIAINSFGRSYEKEKELVKKYDK